MAARITWTLSRSKMKHILFQLLLVILVLGPLLVVQFVSSGDQGGPGDLRGYTNSYYTGWPFASTIHSETRYASPKSVKAHPPKELVEPRLANFVVCSILGVLSYGALAFVWYRKFPRYAILDIILLVSAAGLTAAYFRYETDIFWPTYHWTNFEYSSLHWQTFIKPFWLSAGIAAYFTTAFGGLLHLLVSSIRAISRRISTTAG